MIQRWVRGHLGRKRAAECRRLRIEAAKAAEMRRLENEQIEERRVEEERRRRMHPETPADFALLRAELQRWASEVSQRFRLRMAENWRLGNGDDPT